MAFWIVALGLAGITAAVVVQALWRGRVGVSAAAYDLGVYRDQLSEIDRDVERSTLPQEDAERARLEISRRVLDADKALAGAGGGARPPHAATLAAAAVAVALLVAGTLGLYAKIGAPGYPDLPLSTRIALAEEARATRPSQHDAEDSLGPARIRPDADPAYVALVEQLRAVVAERPGDARGLALLARNEASLGNYPAAHVAQARLVALKGEAATAADYADLADMLILSAGGYVSPEAEAALTEALGRDPRNPTARYYSGLLFAQTGRADLAFRFWATLLSEGPADAPWIGPIRAQIGEIAARAGQHNFELPDEGTPRGPSQADIAAAGELDPEARVELIRGMVAGLAARLAAEGGPASDWARLIRAYGVLGETGAARPILTEARKKFAGDAVALAAIEAAAIDAGLSP